MVILVSVWIDPGPGGGPILLQGFSVTPFVQLRFLANSELGCKSNSFCDCIFVPKRGMVLTIFMYYWMESENYSCTIARGHSY